MEINISRIKKIYFVGIKGVAMAALAIYAKESGFEIYGSDIDEVFPTDEELGKAGIVTFVGFNKEHINRALPDLVIYTGAHGGVDNIEVLEAVKLFIPVVSQGQALGFFMQNKRQISVAGSHGKTTTSAMIATIMFYAGYNPSFAIGCGSISGLGSGGHLGGGEWFIAEADEYVTDPGHDMTPRFLWQKPEILIITNIDYDHPDIYGSLTEVKAAFKKFMGQVKNGGHIVINSDDKEARQASHGLPVVLVGQKGDISFSDIHFEKEETHFQLVTLEGKIPISLNIPGIHNVGNAALAATACSLVGISWDKIAQGLALFKGTKRRFEKLGKVAGVTFYDDYAHHPVEIAAVLSGAKLWFPKNRMIAVFQPHTYSRTKALLSAFSKSFTNAQTVLLTDIYASAREHDRLGITGETLYIEAQKYHKNVYYAQHKKDTISFLNKYCHKGDVVIFMGAGDIYRWGREITNEFKMTNHKG